jgi:phenylpropionate dioxygenase-like ring-hydroxylating dioxygenase large terminal subunit
MARKVAASLQGLGPEQLAGLFDEATGVVSAAIYADPAIYQLELERVFSRSWLVVAHESHLPKPGDYLASYIAEDPVIVVRQKDQSIRVLLNQCRHRGMKICRTDGGNAKAFTCSYHGWAYNIAGDLVNVPMEEQVYPGLDKSKWGARRARVATYKGLVFATWNEDAPALIDYLGSSTRYLDAILDRSEGGAEAIGGIIKWVIPCNWKFAAEQFCSDMYHGGTSHVSPNIAAMGGGAPGSGPPPGPPPVMEGRQFRAPRGGHGTGFFVSDAEWGFRVMQSAGLVSGFDPGSAFQRVVDYAGADRARVASQHITIFPNFSVFNGVGAARIWHPRGPNEIEVWAFALVDKAASKAEREQARVSSLRTFGPAGTFEQDDGENWVEIQRVLRGHEARRTLFNAEMGQGALVDGSPAYPNTVATAFSEGAARGFYAHWQQLLMDPSGQTCTSEAYAHAAG